MSTDFESAGYKRLFDKSPQPMWIFDRETLQFLAVNEAAIAHYGYSREEFLSMTIKDIRNPEDVPDLVNFATKLVGEHFGPSRIWQHRKKDGTVIDVEINSNDEIWEERPARLVLVIDVTQRLRAERELAESQYRYQAAVQATAQILFDWDLESNAIVYGGSVQEKLGYDICELSGGLPGLRQRVHPDDLPEFEKEIERVIRTLRPFSLEFRLRKKDGDYIYVEGKGHFAGLADGQQRRMIGFLTDITARRLLEAQLIQAQKMEAVGYLAGGVAHDFNNILGVISGYAQLLQTEREDNKFGEYLEQISTATRRAALLTRQLLAFGRKQVLQPRVLNLNSVLDGLEKTLGRLITKETELVIFKNPKLGNVKLDVTQIEQVMMNLVINARDAMPKGGKLTIETTNVHLDEDYCRMHPGVKPGPYVMVAVTDTGVGMDSVTLSRIFEPFFTTKERDRGTGLGLAMVYGTVRQSGGHIWVYSEPGEGAVFKLYFPQVKDAVESVVEEHPKRNVEGEETVLVAEDEEAYRRLVIRILEGQGYKVLSAANGVEAIEVARSFAGTIHLLLTDAVLPKLNGRKLADALSASRPALKVLYMSGYTSNVVVHHGMLDPGIEFLHKPFTPNELLGKLRDVLDSSIHNGSPKNSQVRWEEK